MKKENCENEHEHTTALILAAGSGKRMGSKTKKQYLLLDDKPVIYYSLRTFQDSFIDDIVLVVSSDDVDYCQKEIVEKYGFDKVRCIIEGGKERYHSVAAGLQKTGACKYIFIHDGARPLIEKETLQRAYDCVREYDACVVGMPVKDTVKIADNNRNIEYTPDRRLVWQVQTPQVFESSLIKQAYEELLRREADLLGEGISITDDAMVVEKITGHMVKLVEGSYKNIKLTTPEDFVLAACFLDKNEG